MISSYAYTLDDAGNRTKVVEHTGRIVEYTYDDTYKLLEEKITDPDSSVSVISYTYDKVGNRLTKTENGFTTTYTYNENNQLVTEDDITYRYDDNGNLKEKTSAEETVEYFYDPENHLTHVETTRFSVTITVEYEYDAEGNRVRKVIDGTIVTNYLVDTNRDYAQVLEERNGNGDLVVRYVYGHDLISQIRGGTTTYYHYDGLGSTRALTASSEAITDTYTYDAFGLILEQTGTTENNYLYRGEQFDPELGFYYLRARYMDPNVGRFVTMDSFSGFSQDPYSLHKYLYANANPMTYSDPSGNFSITEVQVGTLIRGILSRSDTAVKFTTYRKVLGILGNALINIVDTKLGNGTWTEALINGAIGAGVGAAGELVGMGLGKLGAKLAPKVGKMLASKFGPKVLSNLCKLQVLLPLLGGAYGLGHEINGIIDSIEREEYDQAAFRSLFAVLTVKGMLNAWKSAACFTGETLVYTEKGYKQIKDIEANDDVYSENVKTGEKGFKRVIQVSVRETKVLVHLFIHNVKIKTTPEHPFWVPGKGWIPARQLQVGTTVKLSSDEHREITSIKQEILSRPIKVYNFEVEEWHTYFVSKDKLLVHNGLCGPDEVEVSMGQADAAQYQKLKDQLAHDEAFGDALSIFTSEGKLTQEAIDNAREIIPSSQIGNPNIPPGFSKYSTGTVRSPSGNFQVHFYKNPHTGEVYYGADYKVKFN